MVLYGNEKAENTSNFQHQQPPPPNTQKTKKEAAKAKNFNMTERILIFDLTDINQIIHVCIISIKFN